MKTNRIMILACLVFVILCTSIVIYGKKSVKKINYDEYYTSSWYYILPKEEYTKMYNCSNLDLHNSISDLNGVKEEAEAILIVSTKDHAEMIGEGLIDHCTIEKVIKGEGLEIGQMIDIYEFVSNPRMISSEFLDGSTPLKPNEEYLVFLKKPEYPNRKNTYIYTSIPYGHIIVSNDLVTLRYNIDENHINVKQAMDYQFIFADSTNQDVIDLYENNCKEILNQYIS